MLLNEETIILAIAHKYNIEVYKQVVVNTVATKYLLESYDTDFKLAITENIDKNEQEQLEINGYHVLQTLNINYDYLEVLIREFLPNANKVERSKNEKPPERYIFTKL